ncbi:hypothetical protein CAUPRSCDRAFT_11410 [Caulochytrium protostelioides]|uniref:U3 small nucleolar RNA-associated protein 22 n=1 Tax=Caulochytrium protostelioides TaxID=1555241 RepID=A0A4P9WX48_9FUNG|nr:hypothetical protein CAUPRSCDRAFT_11410 [Caulochytrium protostelioides]
MVSLDSDSADEDEDEAAKAPAKPAYLDLNDGAAKDPLMATPTAAEARELALAQHTALQSNLFALQSERMLSELGVDLTQHKPLAQALFAVKGACEQLEAAPTAPIAACLAVIHEQAVPVPPCDAAAMNDATVWDAPLAPPAKVILVGAFLLKASIAVAGRLPVVDMAVTLPPGYIQKTDRFNYLYFYKRAYYVAQLKRHLAAALARTASEKAAPTVAIHQATGSPLRPIVVVTFPEVAAIHIYPQVDLNLWNAAEWFDATRLIRVKSVPHKDLPPMPHLHAALSRDGVMVAHLNYLNRQIEASPHVRAMWQLSKIWCHQRRFDGAYGEGSAFVIVMAACYLLDIGRLPRESSVFDLFRSAMEFLASPVPVTKTVVMHDTGRHPSEASVAAVAALRKQGAPAVMVDPTGRVNLLGHMTAATWRRFAKACATTHADLSQSTRDGFEVTFLERVPLGVQYNCQTVFCLAAGPAAAAQATGALTVAALMKGLLRPGEMLDDVDVATWIVRRMPDLMHEAFGDRLTAVHLQPTGDGLDMMVRMLTHPAASARRVLDGPAPPDALAVSRFQALWGDAAQMRRFANGRLIYAVVAPESAESPFVWHVRTLLAHLVPGLAASAIRTSLDPLRGVLEVPRPFRRLQLPFLDQHRDVEELGRLMRGLDLPLAIVSVHPVSAGYRRTTVALPSLVPSRADLAQMDALPYVEAVDVIMEFESTGQWPDSLAGIQHMKRAMYIRVADVLDRDCKAHVASTQVVESKTDAYIEVVTTTRLRYHVRMTPQNELQVVELPSTPDAHIQRFLGYASRAQATAMMHQIEARRAYANRFLQQVRDYPGLDTACRLVKRWMAAHLLAHVLPDEVVELLVVAAFQRQPLVDGTSGFLAALHLLAHFDWSGEPLVAVLADRSEVDAAALNAQQAAVIQAFAATMTAGPVAYPVITDEDDPDGTRWLPRDAAGVPVRPHAALWTRLCKLAASALRLYERYTLVQDAAILVQMFAAATDGYDAVLSLDPKRCARRFQSLTASSASASPSASSSRAHKKFANLMTAAEKAQWLGLQIDAVAQYLDALRSYFGASAQFFCDVYGGDRVYVRWRVRPQHPLAKPHALNVAASQLTVKPAGKGLVQHDRAAALENMRILGGSLVVSAALL